MQVLVSLGLPRWCSGKDSACQFRKCKRLGLICGSKRFLGVENGNPLQYSCLGNFHGQKSLAGYSPWGLKELDTTEPGDLGSGFYFSRAHSVIC